MKPAELRPGQRIVTPRGNLSVVSFPTVLRRAARDSLQIQVDVRARHQGGPQHLAQAVGAVSGSLVQDGYGDVRLTFDVDTDVEVCDG